MEQKTSQELKKIFTDLIYDPNAVTANNSGDLELLLEKYPYSQLIRSFYTRSLVDSNLAAFEKELSKAAMYSTNGAILKAIIEDPLSIKSRSLGSKSAQPNGTGIISETDEAAGAAGPSDVQNVPEQESDDLTKEGVLTEGNEENLYNRASGDEIEEDKAPQPVVDQPGENEIGEILASEPETHNTEFSDTADILEEAQEAEQEAVFGELEGAEIENMLTNETDSQDVDVPVLEEEQDKEEQPLEESNDLAGNLVDSLVNDAEINAHTANEDDDLDLLIKQSAASADFLKDEQQLDALVDQTEEVFTPELDIAEKISHNVVIEDQQKISRYDDDKMPYSFLWWLSKTRKEHADNYQPYVSFQLDTSQSIKRNTVDQLSSQIIENIFHLQSPVDDMENSPKTVPFQVKRKEDFILEKFIREEPQIKPPNSEKLDNENKARRSAEDPNDLVSETLAQIYTDQMLFHKAIETYKKLSLKFPEKSTYFADQIRELEKKIN